MNIKTKFDIGDVVYWVGGDGLLYKGEVAWLIITHTKAIKYTVYEYERRKPGESACWTPEEYGWLEAEVPENELFTTEEDMLLQGNKLVLDAQLRA